MFTIQRNMPVHCHLLPLPVASPLRPRYLMLVTEGHESWNETPGRQQQTLDFLKAAGFFSVKA